MQRKVMISCAVTGSADTPGRNPAVPVTPAQIAQSAIDAAKAGAAIVHIHVRDPQTTRPSMDASLYKEVVDRIRASGSDVLINLTTGPGARFVPGDDDPQKPGPGTTIKPPAERVRHVVALKPDICSLDMGSMNMGPHVFINTPSHLLGAARYSRGHELYAKPAAGGLALVCVRHIVASISDGGARGPARRSSAGGPRGQPLSRKGQARAEQRRAGGEGSQDRRGPRRYRRHSRRRARNPRIESSDALDSAAGPILPARESRTSRFAQPGRSNLNPSARP